MAPRRAFGVFEFWATQVLASALVSNVPFAPVATKLPLGEETLYKSLVVVDAAGTHVMRLSLLVNMLPPSPTATYIVAPDTIAKAMLFILGPLAPPLGTEADEGRRDVLTLGVTPVLSAHLDDPYCLRA